MPVSWDAPVLTRLKTQQLLLLVYLYDQRSVFGAARAAHISQPAATKMLRQVEDSLGVQLFTRHARGVEPTPYGEIMARYARNALTELSHAYDQIDSFKHGLSGHVAVGTVVTSATSLVPAAVALLKERSPRVLVSIQLGFSEALIQRLQEGTLDVVVARAHNTRDLPDLNFESVGESPHAILARTGHPLVDKPSLGWRDLEDQTWVLPPSGNVLREHLELFFVEQGLTFPPYVVETDSLQVSASLLRMSNMLAALPRDVVQPYCASGDLTILPIDFSIALGDAGIITPRNRSLSPSAQAMLGALRDALAMEERPLP